MSQLVKQNNDFSLLLHGTNNLPRPFAAETFLLACHVAGTSYRDLTAIEPQLEINTIFNLRREPDNQHDALAIAIYHQNNAHLGYVPKQKNEVLARLLDAGKLLVARLVHKEWQSGYSNQNWLRLDVEIFLRDF